MNMKNTLLAVCMVTTFFTNSIAVAMGPLKFDGADEVLVATAIGLIGSGAGFVFGVQESKVILGKRNKKSLGKLAKPAAGAIGAVGGAIVGGVVGYAGYAAIKAAYNAATK